MDLLATVRKEGSRGGRADFKWSDVQNSTRREHYLGHSLMAPVGRWAKGRDLNWYAKGDEENKDGENPAERAARERKEEIQKVKEAEEDALARALGLPVPQRNNANMEPVSDKRHTDKSIAEPSASDDHAGRSRDSSHTISEQTQGNGEPQDKELQFALKEYRRRHKDDDRRHSSHSHDRHRRRDASDRDRNHHRSKRRERSWERHRAHRSRSRSPSRRHERYRDRSRSRSRSPRRSRRDDSKRH